MITFIFILALLLFVNLDFLAGFLAPHNLAEIGVVVLGIIAVSASVQIRSLFEKAQDILLLYSQYTNPNSEEGRKLSPQERERLLDLLLNELRIIIDQFGGKSLVRIGGIIRKVFNKLFG